MARRCFGNIGLAIVYLHYRALWQRTENHPDSHEVYPDGRPCPRELHFVQSRHDDRCPNSTGRSTDYSNRRIWFGFFSPLAAVCDSTCPSTREVFFFLELRCVTWRTSFRTDRASKRASVEVVGAWRVHAAVAAAKSVTETAAIVAPRNSSTVVGQVLLTIAIVVCVAVWVSAVLAAVRVATGSESVGGRRACATLLPVSGRPAVLMTVIIVVAVVFVVIVASAMMCKAIRKASAAAAAKGIVPNFERVASAVTSILAAMRSVTTSCVPAPAKHTTPIPGAKSTRESGGGTSLPSLTLPSTRSSWDAKLLPILFLGQNVVVPIPIYVSSAWTTGNGPAHAVAQ
jgi:hypothetical protein